MLPPMARLSSLLPMWKKKTLRLSLIHIWDIDKETFRTMFSLTSDELRSLRNTTDVTAKLLTAGSGTGASPARALSEVQERLAEYTSRAAGIEHSLVRLMSEQDELRTAIALSLIHI